MAQTNDPVVPGADDPSVALTTELANTNQFLRALLESLQEGIVACNADGVLTLFNEATRQFHGLPHEALSAPDWPNHYDLYRGDGVTRMTHQEVPLFRALRGEIVRDAEMVIAPKSGPTRTLLANGEPIYDPTGRLLGAVVSMQDITRRKQAEDALQLAHDELEVRVRQRTAELSRANAALHLEIAERKQVEAALRESEARYRTLFESIDEGYCVIEMIFDDHGKPIDYVFLDINPAFIKFTGFTNAIGKSIRSLVPNHEEHWFRIYGEVATTGNPVRFTNEAHAMGRWYDVYAARIGAAGSNQVAVLFHDITAARKAEVELRASEERFRQIAESVDAVFYVLDLPERQVRYVSPGYERMWMLSADELYHDRLAWSRRIHPGDAAATDAQFEAFLRGGPPFDTNYRIILPNGALRWVRDRATVASRDAAGNITRITGIAEDITPRQLAEEKLRHSEERFRTIVGAVSSLIWTNNAEGKMEGEQPGWASFTGQTFEEYQGYGWANALHPDDAQPSIDAWNAAVANQTTFHFEHRLRRHDGQWRMCSVRAVPVVGQQGEVREWVGVHTDITEQRESEHALRESEERFRNMADNAPVMVWVTDADGSCTYLSSSWFEYTGQEPTVALGLGWTEAVHPDHRMLSHDAFVNANAQQAPYHVEYRLRRYDGEYRWFIDAAVPRHSSDGKFLGYIGSVTDITDQKLAEERVQESRARLQFSLESAQIGDWDYDLTTGESRRSLRHDQCFGYAQAVEHWNFDILLQHVHPHDRASVEQQFRACLAQQTDWRSECRVIWPDGSEHWITLHGSVYKVTNGAPTHMLGIVANIDDRKRMENQLRQNAADLSEADRRKNEFLAMLAHELRNPLAPIRNALQIVKLAGSRDAMTQTACQVMDRQVDQMVRLVDDLLDVSRITRDRIELRRETIELAPVLQQAIETSRPAIERAGHSLIVRLPEGPIYLHADAVRLAQMFSNLLNNAAKYSEPGGTITLTAQQLHDKVQISFKDTGVGIPADMLPRIFDMFTQVDRSLERSQGGLGIGLTLVQRLTELHGGSVTAYSDGAGLGSEFTITLPLVAKPERNLEDARSTAVATTTSARRVLVVDDNVDAANSLAMLLALQGNETRIAHDGLAAVEAAGDWRPDLVLLDIGLPKLNGYEAARRMRDLPHGADLAIVALTGWGQDEDRRKSKEAGIDGHLVKPVDHAALSILLATLLQRPSG